MEQELTLVRIGHSARLERLLPQALAGIRVKELSPEQIASAAGRRLLFAAALDEYGPDETFFGLLRTFRKYPDYLNGCLGGVIIDGAGELYTKQAARELVLAANLAGCAFPGKPLVEGTGSLYNQHIQAGLLHLSWEQTYAHQLAQLAQRLLQFELPSFDRPKLLMLHASDNMRSNTVWLGKQVLAHLPATFETKTISLQNGSIHDCRGCSYEACLHFAAQSRCFYGGSISDEVLPAISACDAMLFLCPNYNDAVSANIMALFNRLTNLLVKQDLYQKYLYGIVVSGYSGSDIVARQLLGAIYPGKWIATGISKGGTTTMLYATFFPGDVDGYVPYVGPVNRSREDGRHEKFLRRVGTADERAAVERFQTEVLRRRDRLMPRFEAYCREKGYEFRAPLTEIYDLCALEYAFSFWQWGSNSYEIPATSATDDELFDYFIGAVDPEYFVRETPTTSFFVQAARELGYYGYDTRPLRKYLSIRNSKDYLRRIFLPDELRDLDFDRTLYRRMHRYLKREDPNMVMIYGANDPWTASGAAWAVTPRKRNMKLFVQPGGSHRTRIATLPKPMREEAIAAIRGWLE